MNPHSWWFSHAYRFKSTVAILYIYYHSLILISLLIAYCLLLLLIIPFMMSLCMEFGTRHTAGYIDISIQFQNKTPIEILDRNDVESWKMVRINDLVVCYKWYGKHFPNVLLTKTVYSSENEYSNNSVRFSQIRMRWGTASCSVFSTCDTTAFNCCHSKTLPLLNLRMNWKDLTNIWMIEGFEQLLTESLDIWIFKIGLFNWIVFNNVKSSNDQRHTVASWLAETNTSLTWLTCKPLTGPRWWSIFVI